MIKILEDKELRKNGLGYTDPTAYTAIKNIQEDEIKINKLLKTIFCICELAGFDIQNRIVFVDKETGKVWR